MSAILALTAPFRKAEAADAHVLTELINYAGEGLPLYLWQKMAEPGESAWDVGERRARREQGAFSYRNAIVVEAPLPGGERRVAACLIGYRLPDEPEPIDPAEMPAMFVALQELENLAPGTWYVNVLAVYPEYRGRGYGTKLLTLAERIAAGGGSRGLSIIVADSNAGARRLYERCGYLERATRAVVKDDWQSPAKNWVLLVKST